MSMSNLEPAEAAKTEPGTDVEQLDLLLDELESLSRSQVSRQEFYQNLLDRSVLALGAKAGCVLMQGPEQQWIPIFHCQLESIYPNLSHARFEKDRKQLNELVENDNAFIVENENERTDYLIMARSIEVDAATKFVLAIYVSADMQRALARSLLPLVDALAEIVLEFERAQQHGSAQEIALDKQRIHQFALAIHSYRSVRQVAYDIANDGIGLTGCQRITVLQQNSWGTQLLATSGLADVDSRSNIVRSMRRLAASVNRYRSALIWTKENPDVPKHLRSAFSTYLNYSDPQFVAVVPVHSKIQIEKGRWAEKGHVVAAIVFESFEPVDTARVINKLRPFAEQACSGLRQASRLESIPFRSLWTAINTVFRWFSIDRIPKTAIALLLVGIAMLAAFSIKTDWTVEIRGELRPQQENNLFAPVDGIVEAIDVSHGDLVEAGAKVLQLRSPELEKEIARVKGEVQTARKKLDSIETALAQVDNQSAEDFIQQSKLASELEEQKQVIANLEGEQRFFELRKSELIVNSNVSGQVVTWNLTQTLKDRPVRRGESLMKIADVNGNWHIEFQVPDQKFGYLQTATGNKNKQLDIEFVLATNPEKKYSGKITAKANTSQRDEKAQSVVRVLGEFNKSKIKQLRPGAIVTARVDCGRKSIAYVWTYEFIDSIKRRFFW